MTEKSRKSIIKIIQHANKVIDYVKGMTQEQFEQQSLTFEAVAFNVSQIGELAMLCCVLSEKAASCFGVSMAFLTSRAVWRENSSIRLKSSRRTNGTRRGSCLRALRSMCK